MAMASGGVAALRQKLAAKAVGRGSAYTSPITGRLGSHHDSGAGDVCSKRAIAGISI